MAFDVYAVGDSAFLAEVMNAAASIFQYSGYVDLIKIGMLLGVLIIAFKTLINQKFEIHQLLVIFIMFGLFFKTADTTVVIHDGYSGADRVVDNIPIGFAATTSIASSIGKNITDMFETAYTTINVTTGGYLELPKLLLESRKISLKEANSLGGVGRIELTIQNYLSECTYVGIDRGYIPESRINNSSNLINDMQFDSPVYSTLQFLPSDPDEGTDRYCGGAGVDAADDAFVQIKDYIDNSLEAAWRPVLQSRLGTTTPFVDVQNAMNVILPAVSQNSYQYMLQALMKKMVHKANTYDALTYSDSLAAITETEASEQRNFQWAMEQSMFLRIMMPMMTFIESLVFAIMPLAAFLMMLGTPGIMLAGKYLYLLLWVTLWKPVISIINLYASMKMEGQLSNYQNSNDLLTLQGMPYLESTLADWIGVAGMLTASTPAITLMLIYGSAVTATHLASRMQGADHIDEKNASPDILKNNASVTNMGQGQIHPAFGYNQHGQLETSSNMNIDQGSLSSMVNSASAYKDSSSKQLQMSTQSVFQSLASSGFGRNISAGTSESTTGSGTQTWQTIEKKAHQFAEDNGFGEKAETQIAGAMVLALSGDRQGAVKALEGLQKTQAGARGQGSVTASKTDTSSQSSNFKELQSDVLDYSHSYGADLRNALSADFKDQDTNVFDDRNVASTQKGYTEASTQMNTAEDSYNTATSLSRSIGSGWSGKTHDMANKQISSGNYDALMKLANRDGVIGRYLNNLRELDRNPNMYGGAPEMRNAVAANKAIMDAISSPDGANTYSGLLNDYAPLAGFNSVNNMNPESNAGLKNQDTGAQPYDHSASGRSEVYGQTTSNINTGNLPETHISDSVDATNFARGERAVVANEGAEAVQAMNKKGVQEFMSRENMNQSEDLTNKIYNHLSNAGGNIGNTISGGLMGLGHVASDILNGRDIDFNAVNKATQKQYDQQLSHWQETQPQLNSRQQEVLASIESGRAYDGFSGYWSLPENERSAISNLEYNSETGREFIAATNRDMSLEAAKETVAPILGSTTNVTVELSPAK